MIGNTLLVAQGTFQGLELFQASALPTTKEPGWQRVQNLKHEGF